MRKRKYCYCYSNCTITTIARSSVVVRLIDEISNKLTRNITRTTSPILPKGYSPITTCGIYNPGADKHKPKTRGMIHATNQALSRLPQSVVSKPSNASVPPFVGSKNRLSRQLRVELSTVSAYCSMLPAVKAAGRRPRRHFQDEPCVVFL